MPEIVHSIATPAGEARATVAVADGHRLLCLGHGAGGGVEAPDLLALRDAALTAGWTVARVEQPYRVSGRRAPAPAARLDAAWTTTVNALRDRYAGPVAVGGRSSGARVACRTAAACAAVAVVCLAFPLRPPRRPASQAARRSRAGELSAVTVPLLVVQGERDPFGAPSDFPPGVPVVAVPGDHSLRASAAAAAQAAVDWLQRVA